MRYRYNRNIRELFLRLLPVQIFLVIAGGLSGIINGLIVGNMLSDTAMVALGLTAPLSSLLAALASIVSGGSAILCGNYMGRGEVRKVNEVFSNAIMVVCGAGLVLSLLIFLCASPMAVMFGSTAETMEETILFIRGSAFGVLPLLMMPCLMTFLQICNKSALSLASTGVLAVFNTLICLFFVYVRKGGIFSVALATSLSILITDLFMIGYLLIRRDLLLFRMKDFNAKMMKEMLVLGSPASLAGIMYAIRNIFINSNAAIVGGITAVNSLAILGSCDCFFDCLNLGAGNTLSMLAGVFVGERDVRSLKELMKIALTVGLIQCTGKIMFAVFLGRGFAMMFDAEGAVVDSTWKLLLFYNLCSPINIFSVVFIGVYQNLDRVAFCNMLYPINCLIVPAICCFFLSRIFGIDLIFGCYIVAEIVTLTCIYVTACRKKKGLAKDLDDMLYLGQELDADGKYSISIREIPEVVNVSERVQEFCLSKGIDKRRSMLAGLCMEEMAGNVVEHGFNKDKRKHSIDVFACVDGDDVLLRLRDNCVPFDPHSKLQMHEGDDPVRNVGIKLVSRIAKEMNYQTTYGMNVLNIRL